MLCSWISKESICKEKCWFLTISDTGFSKIFAFCKVVDKPSKIVSTNTKHCMHLGQAEHCT